MILNRGVQVMRDGSVVKVSVNLRSLPFKVRVAVPPPKICSGPHGPEVGWNTDAPKDQWMVVEQNVPEEYLGTIGVAVLDRDTPAGDRHRILTDRERVVVYSRDQGVCYLCQETVLVGDEVDHIGSIHSGGVERLWNLAIVHRRCNRSKSAKSPGAVVHLFQSPDEEVANEWAADQMGFGL